jgi:hypothetical protein
MARIRLLLRVFAGAVGFLLYVWYAAVRATPSVKARKARRKRGSRR